MKPGNQKQQVFGLSPQKWLAMSIATLIDTKRHECSPLEIALALRAIVEREITRAGGLPEAAT